MNTTGNSSPLALCSVIIVTASAFGFWRSTSATSDRVLQEVIERREPDLAALVDHRLRRAGDELLHVLDALHRPRAPRP